MNNFRWAVEPLVITVCVVAVLLATAATPDRDEFTRGIPAALVAWLLGKFVRQTPSQE